MVNKQEIPPLPPPAPPARLVRDDSNKAKIQSPLPSKPVQNK